MSHKVDNVQKLTRITRERVAKNASNDVRDMDGSKSLLADDVGERSNEVRLGANESITAGYSSCEFFVYSGHGYAYGAS